MSERTEMRPVNVGGTTIPDPDKIADYHSPYPQVVPTDETLPRVGIGTVPEVHGSNGQVIHPCTPAGYKGPVAPDGWPIGEVGPKIPY